MKIDIKIDGIEKVKKELEALGGAQFKSAVATTLNQIAGRYARGIRTEMARVFDRPTPYVLNSVKVDAATSSSLAVTISPSIKTPSGARGGKIGVDPQKILSAQAWGGARRDKKTEVLLRQRGWLRAGYQTAIPQTPYPGSDDGRGNLKGPFLRSVMSYLQMYYEQGHFQNMKRGSITRKEDRRSYSNVATRRSGRDINGVVFFIAGPQMTLQIEGGERAVMRATGGSRTRHLHPGIWAKTGGSRGTKLQPVLLFVRSGTYQPRLDMDKIARELDVQGLFAKWLRGNIRDQYRMISVKAGA